MRAGVNTGRKPRILFVELWRLGDAVSATGGLRALRAAVPNAVIGVVAHSFHGDPLFRSPDADVRIPFDAFWTRGKLPRDKYLPWTIDYAGLVRGIRQLRNFRADHVLLFRGDVREQIFFSLLSPGRVSDLDGPHSWFPGVPKYRRPEGVPRWKEYLSHIRQWSGMDVLGSPTIAGVRRSATQDPYILIHPGASWRFKQWSATKIARLVEYLRALGYPVRLVAGPEDVEFAGRVTAELKDSLPFVFPSLEELYSLVADAWVVICNNSAALHIAEALGTRCISLTGPSDPVKWGTYRDDSRTIARSTGLPCHPCGEKRCVRPVSPCIELLELADVITALEETGALADVKGRLSIGRPVARVAR